MRPGSKLLRRLMIAGLAGGAALCIILAIAFREVAGAAHPRRPNTVEAFLDPPRVDVWERIDLLLFRGHAASRGTGSGAAAVAAPRRAPAGELVVPEALPGELAAYLEGAIAYRRGDLAAARDHWQRLLALPAAARHYRSTWAAFMLGRAALRQRPPDPAAAARWFRQTRELAARGFADSLGLAVLSLGWEARAEVARQRFERAEALYAQQARMGDATAIDSFTIFWRERLIRAVVGQ
jgi:hypothetical protein